MIENYAVPNFGLIIASVFEQNFKITSLDSNAMSSIIHSAKTVYSNEVDFIDIEALDTVFKEVTGRLKDVERVRSLLNLSRESKKDIAVSANPSVELEEIEDFLTAKVDYIISALAYYENLARYAPQPKEYVDGETFLILGKEQRLKVVTAKKNYVTSDESYITLYVKNEADHETKKRTMEKWLQRICQEQVRTLCEAVYPKFRKYGVEYPVIRFRNMISQWGSCQPKRHILTFNYALVEAPLSCMEYVVVHEFNHFLHPNHSKRFYQQLAMFMPDWEQRKALLEKYHNRTC